MEAAEIDKELEELETKAEHLRAMYEQYFMGIERLEPLNLRRDVDRRVRALRREQLRNTAQRFKFNTLVQRFNTMQSYWARIVREIENGTYKRDVIKAAARFGESALAVLGKKKTKDLIAAVARQASAQQPQGKRSIEDTFELHSDDLIEEDDEEDEAPTPPRLEARLEVRPAAAAQWGAPLGLGQGDLPVVGALPQALGRLPAVSAPPPRAAGPVPAVAADPRWGAPAAPPSDQQGSAVRAMAVDGARASRPVMGFGELDLDFDDAPPAPLPVVSAPAPRAGAPAPGRATGIRPLGPLPTVTPPPARAPAPAVAAFSGFGVLDVPLDDPPAAPAPVPVAPAQSSPGSGIRQGANRPAPAAAPAPAARSFPPAGPVVPAPGELHDQRIRQIYAKYVETKRSTQESTAGVTYEKLAASLRAQADKLKSAHPNRSIDYEVVVKDGKTHLKPVLR